MSLLEPVAAALLPERVGDGLLECHRRLRYEDMKDRTYQRCVP